MRIPTPAKIALAVVAVGAVVAVAIGPPPESNPTTSAEAVTASGAETGAMTDPVHDRTIELSTWSPADNDRSHLVVISHGFAGDRTSHAYLAAALAADGYTVVAPTHPDLGGLESGNTALDPLVLRPRHVSLAIDAAEQDASFEHVSVIGYSIGGYGALRAVGADISIDGIAPHCEVEPDDAVLCNETISGRFDELAAAETPEIDERVDRVVLLAPGYGPLFPAEALADVAVPVLVIDAAADDEVSVDQVDSLVSALPEGTQRQTVEGGHFVFVRSCTADEAAQSIVICQDPDGVDRQAVHNELVSEIETFLAG